MRTIILDSLSGKQIADAIFKTLLHSLWLGVLLSLAAGLIVLFTKKKGPQIRYQLLTGLLSVFLLAELLLFSKSIRQHIGEDGEPVTGTAIPDENFITQLYFTVSENHGPIP